MYVPVLQYFNILIINNYYCSLYLPSPKLVSIKGSPTSSISDFILSIPCQLNINFFISCNSQNNLKLIFS